MRQLYGRNQSTMHGTGLAFKDSVGPAERSIQRSFHHRGGCDCMKASSEKSVILVVDDDVDCREMLADLLSNEGYAVACAENGLQALDYLSGATPARIILDLMMPEMSGWEFRARQKIDPRLESLPVVV